MEAISDMSIKTCLIKDDFGKIYVIKDISLFQKHLFEFHESGVSLHEENGRYFTINDKFRKKIDNLVKGNK